MPSLDQITDRLLLASARIEQAAALLEGSLKALSEIAMGPDLAPLLAEAQAQINALHERDRLRERLLVEVRQQIEALAAEDDARAGAAFLRRQARIEQLCTLGDANGPA